MSCCCRAGRQYIPLFWNVVRADNNIGPQTLTGFPDYYCMMAQCIYMINMHSVLIHCGSPRGVHRLSWEFYAVVYRSSYYLYIVILLYMSIHYGVPALHHTGCNRATKTLYPNICYGDGKDIIPHYNQSCDCKETNAIIY